MIISINLFGILAGIISFFAFVTYYISIYRKETQPNIFTWTILFFLSLITLISYYKVGAKETIWMPLSLAIGQLITFVLALKYGVKKIEHYDKWCLIGVIVCLIIWYLTDSALLVLILTIIIDFFGMLPTIFKIYNEPESEAPFPWLLDFFASLLNIFAINKWVFGIWVYPIYMLLIYSIVVILLYIYRPYKNHFKVLRS